MSTTATVGAEAHLPSDIKIIDCDAHWTEPADLWTSRVPRSLQSKVPVQRTVDGRTAWYINGELWSGTGGNTIDRERRKVRGTSSVQPFEEIHPSASVVADRLELMDDSGLFAQVLYPNGIGFASNHIFAIDDLEQRQMVLQVYNDHLVEVQSESDGRLFPQAMLPVWNMDLTVREMTRLIDKGIRGFTLSGCPELLGLPELPEPYYEPMWDVFNETGAAANFHIAAGMSRAAMEASWKRTAGPAPEVEPRPPDGEGPEVPAVLAPSWRSFSSRRSMAVSSTQGYISNARIIANLCNSDLFDRFPKLRIASAESGIGWVPFILEAMDFHYDEYGLADEPGFSGLRPSDHFREHIHVMFWFESATALSWLNELGVSNVMVETDIPHPTCLYPDARQHFTTMLAGTPEALARQVLQENAADLYRIDT